MYDTVSGLHEWMDSMDRLRLEGKQWRSRRRRKSDASMLSPFC